MGNKVIDLFYKLMLLPFIKYYVPKTGNGLTQSPKDEKAFIVPYIYKYYYSGTNNGLYMGMTSNFTLAEANITYTRLRFWNSVLTCYKWRYNWWIAKQKRKSK